ncbi:hypothetical protein [Diplocloster agilis]|uniref:Uncharacterized protein n=1 Tax=Diplocloster agilis TaxID=2850323 RepID=A0A949K3T4_9FIRM|nr:MULTISPECIES: hypothetical protein [Lachnospiraceae]MBU9738867.1 hypothetical protein [Diplocloster agilis]MCU6734901.1 hypothetical protein [Suonthocola fibrivorans]SCJ58532.1 Uncharacterised protein [uncultured Clostridium sp.]DAE53233.1 MAG TPA: hypothetical protein [Caudoviricetes sp.]
MLFPLIKIKDLAVLKNRPERVVGTNTHDSLYIDKESGGIQYLNLQCCEGTKKYGNSPVSYQFSGENNEYSPYCEITFVTFEQLCEVYLEETRKGCEAEKAIRNLIKETIAKHEQIIEEYNFDDDDRFNHTAGILL